MTVLESARAAEATRRSADGLRLAVRRVEGMPLFALRIIVPGGSSCEERPGLAWSAGRMLAEGTSTKSWCTLSTMLEGRGVSLSSSAGLESHGVALDCLADDWEWALDLAVELLGDSSFPEDRLDWIKRQGAAELESLADQPEIQAGWAFLDQLYRPHPAGRPLQGSSKELLLIGREEVRDFHRRGLAGGLVVTAAGGIDEARVASRIEGLLSDLPATRGSSRTETGPAGRIAGESPVPPSIVGARSSRRSVEVSGEGQHHLYAGHLTIDRMHQDLAALELLAVVAGAGAGLAGRFPTRVREVEGLCYTTEVGTASGAGRLPGRFVVYCACAPERTADVERAIRDELEILLSRGVSNEEVHAARSYLLGRQPFLRETSRQWCDLLAEALFYSQPYDDLDWSRRRLEEQDADTVTASTRRHLAVERLRVTIGESRPGTPRH